MRLIDVDAFKAHWNKEYRMLHPKDIFIVALSNFPTIEAEPVVRCCECKRRYDADECPMCFLIDGEYHEYTNGNGYCDRGERRNGDATD